MMSVEGIASFSEVTGRSPASQHQQLAVPNQTRQPSGKYARTVNTQVVDMNPVNCLFEHMLTILVFVPAEREDD